MSEATATFPNDNWRLRCDWCGWNLYLTPEEGCVWDNCSMRPMPELVPLGKAKQLIRHLERRINEYEAATMQKMPEAPCSSA